MRHTNQISGCAALALVLLASNPLAAQTASFSITGTFTGGSLDGIYTSPYPGTVNGSTVPVICDDFANNSYNPEDWTAYVTSLSSVNANPEGNTSELRWTNADSGGPITISGVSSGLLGSSTDPYAAWTLDQQTAYDVAAYLAIEITEAPAASQTSEDLSYALWELFDATGTSGSKALSFPLPDTVVNWLNGNPNSGDKDLNTLASATQDVEAAITAVCDSANCEVAAGTTPSVLSGWNVNIYSFDSCTVGGVAGTNCNSSDPPQEFMTATHVPESSSLAVFGVYVLFAGVGLFSWGRRRLFEIR